jgi:basic amino acid/polyamine antiporter, APA family
MTAVETRPRATLSVVDGVAILVGIVVGIGIFKTPQIVAANSGSELVFLGLWLLGGAITLIGALVYAELGAAYPNSGGEYHFLNRALGQKVSLLFAWARSTVVQPGAIAAVAFVFADYAQELWPLGGGGPLFYAAAGVIGLTLLNLVGSAPTKGAQLLLTSLTIGAISIIVLAALIASPGEGAEVKPATAGMSASGAVGLAMIFILLTYGGWNETAYLSAEIKDVRRNMVRVLVFGTALITLIYVSVNVAMLNVLGLGGVAQSDAVAADTMRAIAGDGGAFWLSLLICVAALSTLNATIFTGARLYYALGRDMPLFGRLGVWEVRGNKPANALLVQSAIALALVGLGALTRDGFTAMVEYTAPVFWGFLLLVGVSFFVLRIKEPDRPRPFTVPLYPVVPLLFCITCTYLLYSSLAYTGYGALFGVAVLLAGTPLLFMQARSDLARAKQAGQV